MVVLCPSADACGAAAGMGERRSSASSSPDFEFWMVRNPSVPLPDLLSADELFVDGVILPLRLRHQPASDMPYPQFGSELQPERVSQPQAEGEWGPQPPVASITAAESATPASSSSPSQPLNQSLRFPLRLPPLLILRRPHKPSGLLIPPLPHLCRPHNLRAAPKSFLYVFLSSEVPLFVFVLPKSSTDD